MLDRTKQPSVNNIDKVNFATPEVVIKENGKEFYGFYSDKDPIIKVEFILPAGRLDAENPLVPSLVSKLFGRATSKHNSDAMADLMDYFGISFKTIVTDDYTLVSFYSISKFKNNLLDLIFEIFEHNNFEKKDFEVELERAKSSFLVNLEKTDFLANREFLRNIYPQNYYKLLELSDFEKITIEDLNKFVAKYFNFAELILVLSGDFDDNVKNRLKNFVENYSPTQKKSKDRQPFILENQSKYKCVKKADSEQSTVVSGRITIDKKHPDYQKLAIVNTILGGYFGSRLSRNIREEKGFTYGVYSVLRSKKDHSVFKIEADVANEVVNDYLKEVEKEVVRLREEKVSEDELTLVRNYLNGAMLSSFDGIFEQASVFASLRINGLDFGYYDSFFKLLNVITADDVRETAAKYLDFEDMVNVVAGKC